MLKKQKKKPNPALDFKDKGLEKTKRHQAHIEDERRKRALRNFNFLDFQDAIGDGLDVRI